jgi:Cys-tRNA synthase (O-phospho-L-seryl-tRNA:Cys-tRNA synthase)
MRGSSSTEINMMEEVEDGSLSPVAVHSNYIAAKHESSSTFNIADDERPSFSLPPVEFKVMAHHAMHGSGSTKINMMEEVKDGSLSPVAVHSNYIAAKHESSSTYDVADDEQPSFSLPPVEFKVTACHAMHGSGSTKINMMEEIKEGSPSPVAVHSDYISKHKSSSGIAEINVTETRSLSLPPNMSKQGFRHLYRSTRTTSSLQVLAAHKATVKHGPP